MLEHPDITHARLTGYPRQDISDKAVGYYPQDTTSNIRNDFYGDSLDVTKDHYVELPTGYLVLHRNLQRYLEERKGFEFSYYLGDGEDSE